MIGKTMIAGAVLALTCATGAAAQVTFGPGGPSTIGSDTKNGSPIRLVNRGFGADKIVATSEPWVAFVCAAPSRGSTTCHAYVQKNQRVNVTINRIAANGTPPGQAPVGEQWMYDCKGTTGATCTISTDKVRTVMVDWSIKP